jgi:hypothetical protein
VDVGGVLADVGGLGVPDAAGVGCGRPELGEPGIDRHLPVAGGLAVAEATVDGGVAGGEHGQRGARLDEPVQLLGHQRAQDAASAVGGRHRHPGHAAGRQCGTTGQGHRHVVGSGDADDAAPVEAARVGGVEGQEDLLGPEHRERVGDLGLGHPRMEAPFVGLHERGDVGFGRGAQDQIGHSGPVSSARRHPSTQFRNFRGGGR